MSECRDCPLWITATNQVDNDGPIPCDWLIVGEAPGYEEDKSGVPFVGASGRQLDRLLAVAGLKRGEVHVTNVIRHRPPKNRKPTVSEVRKCSHYLGETLRTVGAKYTILLGSTALGVFFPKDSIGAVHGRVRKLDGVYYIPMFHPAAMLYDPGKREVIEADWKTLRERIESYDRKDRHYSLGYSGDVVGDVVAVDTETDWDGRIAGGSASAERGVAVFVPSVGSVPPQLVVDAETLVMHNAKFDLRVLSRAEMVEGIHYKRLADTMIAAYVVGEPALGLKSLALKLLGEDMDYLGPMVEEAQIRLMREWMQKADTIILEKKWQKSYDKTKTAANTTEAFQRRKKLRGRIEADIGPLPHASVFDVPLEQLFPYACADADMTRRLWFLLSDRLDKMGLRELYWNVEMPLLPVLMEMEDRGIAVDERILEAVQDELVGLSEESLEKCKSLGDFNPLSPKATLGTLHKLGIRVRDTNKDTLLPYKEEPIVAAILDVREKRKLLGYVRGLKGCVGEGRIHTKFNQVRSGDDGGDEAEGATATGRLSSSEPNLQNIPTRTELGRKIREAFVPSGGMKLVSCDYSQIEPRISAHLSGDINLIAAFHSGEDPYKYVGGMLFGCKAADVTDEQRAKAKTAMLGTNYGLTPHGMSQRNNMEVEEAQQLINTYFSRFPGIPTFMEETISRGRKLGYVETIWGRREYLPDLNNGDDVKREAAERMAINMPIQGTAADIMKLAMVRAAAGVRKMSSTHLLLSVHDEIIAETDDVEECIQAITNAMLSVIHLKVPLVVHSRWGESWGTLSNTKDWSQ